MMDRVPIRPELLHWALGRSGLTPEALMHKFPQLEAWLTGAQGPTLKQLEAFAAATHAPIGFLFLPEPPVERTPIPDFRAMAGRGPLRPSPDLLETIYLCQQRQEWYRDFERSMRSQPLAFVGSARPTDRTEGIAADIRQALGFDLDERRQMRSWTEALRRFIEQADALGVLVMVSGVVGSSQRKLDPREFRGFALVDDLAPLVFINGADTRSAQMFTLAHELAHVWLGETALSDAQALRTPDHAIEQKCNQIAAEILVPLEDMDLEYVRTNPLREEMDRLARQFKVSTLVILRRMGDVGGLTREQLKEEYQNELDRLLSMPKGKGGDYYRTAVTRAGNRFTRALIMRVGEGQTSFTDAFRMLGVKRMNTFRELGRRLEVEF